MWPGSNVMNKGEKKRSRRSDLDSTKSVLKLLSNDMRRNMIITLATKPMDVSSIAELLDCSQSNVRRNLKILTDADLLKVEQAKGNQVYRLSKTISVKKHRGKVMLEAEIPGGGSVAMKLNWPPHSV